VLVDSHCHLNYLDDCDTRLDVARACGVAAFVCIGVNAGTRDAVADISARHADVWHTQGVHPDSAAAETDLTWLDAALELPRVVAVGECGLDYYRLERDDEDSRRRQREVFDHQLALGDARALPVVVHSRAAEGDTIARLRAHPGVQGVLHCFTESWQLAAAALDLGWYVSISGIVTFRNADNVRDVARRIPDDRLLVETDCPWLAPVPHRGRRNEPAFVADTASFLAELRGVDRDRLARQTTDNAVRLFGLQVAPKSSS
jgi:TatD DNase family protein